MQINIEHQLLPYLEDTLDTAQQAQIAARLAADPALAAEMKRLRRTVDSLRQAAARAPSRETADHWPALQARLVLTPAPRRASAWTWGASLAALAAVLFAAGALLSSHRARQAVRPALPQPAPGAKSLAPTPAAAALPAPPKPQNLKIAGKRKRRRQSPDTPPDASLTPPIPVPVRLASHPPLPSPMPKSAMRKKPSAPILSAAKMPAAPRRTVAVPMMAPTKKIAPRLALPDLTPPAAPALPAGSGPAVPAPSPAQDTGGALKNPH